MVTQITNGLSGFWITLNFGQGHIHFWPCITQSPCSNCSGFTLTKGQGHNNIFLGRPWFYTCFRSRSTCLATSLMSRSYSDLAWAVSGFGLDPTLSRRLLTDFGAEYGQLLQVFGGDFVHDIRCILVKQRVYGNTKCWPGTLEPKTLKE